MKEVFFIKPPYKEGNKPYWMKIGVAFVNKDKSLTLKFDVPVLPSMDIVIRDQQEREGKGQSFDDE